MSSLTESVVQEATLSWFEGLGYSILNGLDIAPGEMLEERGSYEEVILARRLNDAIAQSNPNIPVGAHDEVIKKVTTTSSPSLERNKQFFHRILTTSAAPRLAGMFYCRLVTENRYLLATDNTGWFPEANLVATAQAALY